MEENKNVAGICTCNCGENAEPSAQGHNGTEEAETSNPDIVKAVAEKLPDE